MVIEHRTKLRGVLRKGHSWGINHAVSGPCSRSLSCSDQVRFHGSLPSRSAQRWRKVVLTVPCARQLGWCSPVWPGSSRNRRRDETGRPASPRARLDTRVQARSWRRCRLAERISEPQPVSPFGGEQVMEKRCSIPATEKMVLLNLFPYVNNTTLATGRCYFTTFERGHRSLERQFELDTPTFHFHRHALCLFC